MEEKEPAKSRFEAEMTRKIDLLIQKVVGLETEVSEIKSDVSEIKSDVKVLKGQFNDVAVMALEDNKRITKLEGEVAELQSNIH